MPIEMVVKEDKSQKIVAAEFKDDDESTRIWSGENVPTSCM